LVENGQRIAVIPLPARPNLLLDRLGSRQRASVLGGCEEVDLAAGQVLAEPGDTIADVYFPSDSAICLLAPMDDGHAVEVLLVGREGFYGVPLALGAPRSDVRAVVHGPGKAWRMQAAVFSGRLEAAPRAALARGVMLYVQVLMGQLAQAVGCNRFHRVEERVARWLLMTSDRTAASSFVLTHELLATTLGVRRVSVTEAAGALQRRNLISYKRGIVTILDARGLERAACSCYRADIDLYEGSLGKVTAPRG
jgi:CRP-like cAMP-binding protein